MAQERSDVGYVRTEIRSKYTLPLFNNYLYRSASLLTLYTVCIGNIHLVFHLFLNASENQSW